MDPESGLYFYRTRYYNSSVGRFISQDVYQGNIWSPPSLNRYVYVVNDPVNCIDPLGLAEWVTTKTEYVWKFWKKTKIRDTGWFQMGLSIPVQISENVKLIYKYFQRLQCYEKFYKELMIEYQKLIECGKVIATRVISTATGRIKEEYWSRYKEKHEIWIEIWGVIKLHKTIEYPWSEWRMISRIY